MCYLTEAGISALGVFVILDKAGISALGVKRVKVLSLLVVADLTHSTKSSLWIIVINYG